MDECNHSGMIIQPELSTQYVNFYQCSECGAAAYRQWRRSTGLSPLTFYKAPDSVKRRQEWALRSEMKVIDKMKHRDREIDPLDQ